MANSTHNSTLSHFNNNNNNNNNAGGQDDNNNNNDRYRNPYSVPIREKSDETEVDGESEGVPLLSITYTIIGGDYEVVSDDEEYMMPDIVEEYDEPDQDAIALEYAPLANGAE
ncbi:hypothetical protein BGZ88_003660 [Linnemannia elongata]|nr:hypothetical protein BGZ88_003660 [Linnemannia elongata]